jgi:hypothetical protein
MKRLDFEVQAHLYDPRRVYDWQKKRPGVTPGPTGTLLVAKKMEILRPAAGACYPTPTKSNTNRKITGSHCDALKSVLGHKIVQHHHALG